MPRHFLSRLKQRSTTLRLAAGDNLAPATIRAIVLPALAALLSVIAAMHSPWGPVAGLQASGARVAIEVLRDESARVEAGATAFIESSLETCRSQWVTDQWWLLLWRRRRKGGRAATYGEYPPEVFQ